MNYKTNGVKYWQDALPSKLRDYFEITGQGIWQGAGAQWAAVSATIRAGIGQGSNALVPAFTEKDSNTGINLYELSRNRRKPGMTLLEYFDRGFREITVLIQMQLQIERAHSDNEVAALLTAV
jgi:hypothetical protein